MPARTCIERRQETRSPASGGGFPRVSATRRWAPRSFRYKLPRLAEARANCHRTPGSASGCSPGSVSGPSSEGPSSSSVACSVASASRGCPDALWRIPRLLRYRASPARYSGRSPCFRTSALEHRAHPGRQSCRRRGCALPCQQSAQLVACYRPGPGGPRRSDRASGRSPRAAGSPRAATVSPCW